MKITGAGKIVQVPISDVSATYVWSTGRLDMTGNLDLAVGGWGFTAALTSAFVDIAHDTWNVAGHGELRLPGITGDLLNGEGDIVLSANGLAACVGSPGARYGIAEHWRQPLETFAGTCDVKPYSASDPAAHTAAAGSFSVRPHQRLKVIAVHGADAPPKVSLNGPGGEQITAPADGSGLSTSHALLVQDPATNTTYVVLFSPAAGQWSVTPEPGTPAPLSIRTADARPAVQVKARIRGSGAHRILAWKLRPQPGQRVQFVQRGAGGDRVIATTTRARGRVRFAPTLAAARSRTVVALVTENGLPRSQFVVAHFKAPAPVRLRAVRKLRLRGARLRWPSTVRRRQLFMMLGTANGATFSTVSRHASLRVPRSMRGRTLTVTVSALNAVGQPGAVRTATVHRS